MYVVHITRTNREASLYSLDALKEATIKFASGNVFCVSKEMLIQLPPPLALAVVDRACVALKENDDGVNNILAWLHEKNASHSMSEAVAGYLEVGHTHMDEQLVCALTTEEVMPKISPKAALSMLRLTLKSVHQSQVASAVEEDVGDRLGGAGTDMGNGKRKLEAAERREHSAVVSPEGPRKKTARMQPLLTNLQDRCAASCGRYFKEIFASGSDGASSAPASTAIPNDIPVHVVVKILDQAIIEERRRVKILQPFVAVRLAGHTGIWAELMGDYAITQTTYRCYPVFQKADKPHFLYKCLNGRWAVNEGSALAEGEPASRDGFAVGNFGLASGAAAPLASTSVDLPSPIGLKYQYWSTASMQSADGAIVVDEAITATATAWDLAAWSNQFASI